jgi:hypothetical protein
MDREIIEQKLESLRRCLIRIAEKNPDNRLTRLALSRQLDDLGKIDTMPKKFNPRNSMPENQTITLAPRAVQDDEINLLGLLIVLAKHKSMILKITLGVALRAVEVVLLLPNVYTGTARVLPQQGQSSTSPLLGSLADLQDWQALMSRFNNLNY